MLFDPPIVEKKRKIADDGPSIGAASSNKSAPTRPKNNTARSVAKPRGQPNEPAPSTVIERLASFSQPVANPTDPQATRDYGHKRDERLALVENLTPGPYQHKNIPDDPNFDKFEPHSSIRLSYVPPASRNFRRTLTSGASPPQIAEHSARPICRLPTGKVLRFPFAALLCNTHTTGQTRIRGSSGWRMGYYSCGSRAGPN